MWGERYDFLVIGSGLAGLFTSLTLKDRGRVALITKGALEDSNSYFAQGGMAAAVGQGDSPDLHRRDTLAAGAGLCDEPAVDLLVKEGPQRIRDLVALGVEFDRWGGQVHLAREAAHSINRILHVDGDATGRGVCTRLIEEVKQSREIDVYEGHFVVDLIMTEGRCWGALALRNEEYRAFWAPATILATGGVGQVFAETSNPPTATGDGIALAYRAGAKLMDMEFVQFHPTVLYTGGDKSRFLISETVRGEGAVLRNQGGQAFMGKYHPLGDLAPRDVVARAIWTEMQQDARPHVYLDATSIKHPQDRFPTIYRRCSEMGLKMERDWLPVGPAAHYTMGGVYTDHHGRTTIPGLLACGEVACTGIHGANRLASNSLLEAIVFGQRAALAAEKAVSGKMPAPRIPSLSAMANRRALQRISWHYVGLERSKELLTSALMKLEEQGREEYRGTDGASLEAANMAVVIGLMAKAALLREESRGAHYRLDFPDSDPSWCKHIILQRGEDLAFRPVDKG